MEKRWPGDLHSVTPPKTKMVIFPEKIWSLPVATAQKKEKKKKKHHPKDASHPTLRSLACHTQYLDLCRGDSTRGQAFGFVQSQEASGTGMWEWSSTALIQEPDWCIPLMEELTETLGFQLIPLDCIQ